MRRVRAFVLCFALCLGLAACRAQEPPSAPPEQPPAQAPLKLDTLNVEFLADGRDTDALLKLQSEFPQALPDALRAQSVEVGSVAVTFGTSGEATETALKNGAVQLAFLPAEDYFPYRSGMVVALEQDGENGRATGLIVFAVSSDAAADERFAAALRGALPELEAVLASYTGEPANGRYAFDAAQLEQLDRLCNSAS